jgi:predicted unusual protein kinase regulating ubiquinone biosynthesis (AarF/ABC1/UbiB family)
MKTIDKIPSSKIGRAAKIVQTGIKVGGNYASYYGEKIFNPNLTKEKLDENNAKDIYKGLSQLKGSALKVAQMLSMEKNIIPQAYSKEFSQAQYSVPPLSPPLVKKTFKKYVGKSANEVFDAFDFNSYKAASMGQVHKATIGEKTLAVKLQYPGVAESISSDLSLVKPFAIKMFNLKGKDSEKFFQEVEDKLIEETDYKLELKRSIQISESCIKIDKLVFPKYFKEYSGKKLLPCHGLMVINFRSLLIKIHLKKSEMNWGRHCGISTCIKCLN